ncbi:MAG: secretin N-terminal domain-containing protein, partial [Stellaceae bacterium]
MIALAMPGALGACTQMPPAPEPAAPPIAVHPVPPRQASLPEGLPLPPAPPALVHRGTSAGLKLPAGAAPITVSPGGDVTLNFENADIRQVVRAVVGDTLGLNYTIDPKVQGTITVRTSRPLARAAVLPTLARVLDAAGAALETDGGLVRVAPLDAAAKGAAPSGAGSVGYGVRVLPLRYVPADALQKVLAPFVPAGASIQTDPLHDVLVLSGTREDLDNLTALAQSFDTDWLSRTSFALVPLRALTADTIITEMNAILTGPGMGEAPPPAVRLVPVAPLNAVLVIAGEPHTLDWVRQQIEMLDAGSADGAERTYVYHVQYGRATDLADVLGRVFGVNMTGTA